MFTYQPGLEAKQGKKKTIQAEEKFPASSKEKGPHKAKAM